MQNQTNSIHIAPDILKDGNYVEMKYENDLMFVKENSPQSNNETLDRDWVETWHNVYDSHFDVFKQEICNSSLDYDFSTLTADVSFGNVTTGNTVMSNIELEPCETETSSSRDCTQILKRALPPKNRRRMHRLSYVKNDFNRSQEASMKSTETYNITDSVSNEKATNICLSQMLTLPFPKPIKFFVKPLRELVEKPNNNTGSGNINKGNTSHVSASFLKQVQGTNNSKPVTKYSQPVVKNNQSVTKISQPVIKDNHLVKNRQRQLVTKNGKSVTKESQPVIKDDQSVTENNSPKDPHNHKNISVESQTAIRNDQSDIDNRQPANGNNQTALENSQPVADRQIVASSSKNTKKNKCDIPNTSSTEINLIFRHQDSIRKYKRPINNLLSNELVMAQKSNRNPKGTNLPLTDKQKYTSSNKHPKQMKLNKNNFPFPEIKLVFRCKNSTHMNEKTYFCKHCDYVSSTRHALNMHTYRHTGKKTFTCKLCNYKCTHKSRFKSHMRTHTGEKPYLCEICDYKCSQASGLSNHMRTHTGEKPYLCEICDYKCSQASGLSNHMRTHTGEKPYLCEICDYKCSQASGLSNHMRTHTGEKLSL